MGSDLLQIVSIISVVVNGLLVVIGVMFFYKIKTMDRRMDGHSGRIGDNSKLAIANKTKIEANSINDANMLQMFEKLLEAHLRPIVSDIEYIKRGLNKGKRGG